MKHQVSILLVALLLAVLPNGLQAQVYTQTYTRIELKAAKRWAKCGKWRKGFDKARPDRTVNLVDFQRQYERNQEQWDALFAWLESHDLTALPKGKYPIEGTTMVASIQDDTNKPLAERNTESHRKNIDFQYVVSGTEGFALLDHESSTVSKPYDEKKDVVRYAYDKGKTHFFTNTRGCFNIFFPGDWHIAKVDQKGCDEPFRVVVVKVNYCEE